MSKKAVCWGLCLFVLLSWFHHAALAAPQVGWWWNPAESGRGFFVESHDGITFIAGYLYDGDGHAKWVIAAAPNNDAYNFSADLVYFTNGQTLFGPYVAPSNPIVVGRLTAHFSDDTHGSVTWPGGTVAIEREIFGTDTPSPQASPGLWWNSAESGSGYSLEVQGDKLFVVGYMYDSNGRPVWYLSAGSMASPTHYQGTWVEFANGQTMGGAYRAPDPPTTVGYLTIDFTAADAADFTFSDAPLSAATREKAGRSRMIHVKREFPPPPPPPSSYPFADRYDGNFHFEAHSYKTVTGGTLKIDQFVDGPLTLVKDTAEPPALPDPSLGAGAQQHYVALPVSALAPLHFSATYSTSDLGGNCNGSITTTVTPPTGHVFVNVSANGGYSGVILMDDVSYTVPILVTCVTDIDTFTFTLDQPVGTALAITGTILYGMHGTYGPVTNADFVTASGTWDFAVANP